MAEITVTDQNFTDEIEKATMPVLVDFWAPWCGPCKVVGPIVEELAKDYEGKLKVGKMDVDQNPQTSGKYGIMSIPSLMFFKGGKVVKTIIGAQSKETLKNAIDEILAA